MKPPSSPLSIQQQQVEEKRVLALTVDSGWSVDHFFLLDHFRCDQTNSLSPSYLEGRYSIAVVYCLDYYLFIIFILFLFLRVL
jgi:hypothetical protein